MSSWWSINFFATGDLDQIDRLHEVLPSLFHAVVGTERVGGALAVCVAQNYGGCAAVEDMIERCPDLMFNGTQIHEQADAGGSYSSFTGANGSVEWHEHRLREDGRPVTAGEIQDEISELDERIARLRKRRDFYIDTLRTLGSASGEDLAMLAQAAEANDSAGGLEHKGP